MCIDQTPRENALEIERKIEHHAREAATWAEAAESYAIESRDDEARLRATIAQAHAAAAQALALLRQRPSSVERRA